MASLVLYGGGLRRIDFNLTPNGKRRSIRLGRVSAKSAQSVLAKVESLIADKLLNRHHDEEVSRWLGSLDETMLSRLRAAGLAEGVGMTQTTLGEFLGRAMTSLAVKASTRTFYGHTKRNLLTYFTANRLMRDITTADADQWRQWLVDHEGLSLATVGRRVIAARTFWRKAVRWKLASDNPFEGVRGGSQMNESRKRFIPLDQIAKIIDEAPDSEWKLMIGLSRYGGLRCPSEHLALTWADCDWEKGTIRVRSCKTEHHDGHAERVVPMFPELRKLLLDAYDAAAEGAEQVITRYRDPSVNLRTQFQRIIRRAGFKPWPRLWQNLRASRETELLRQYDLATVCRWIGNSPAVAAKHYATSVDLDADFRRAAGLDDEAQQKAQQSASANGDIDGQPLPSDEKERGFDAIGKGCQPVANGVSEGEWAVQDSNL